MRVEQLNGDISQQQALMNEIDAHNAGQIPDEQFYGMPAE
jgi:hypothetical protein